VADVPVSMEFDSAWLAPSGVLGDRYEIQRVLGRGGAAIVLLARDRRYERDVAIKVLKPELAGVVATERFLQEVRITASLQHPHILPLLDSGEGRGLPYYVIPYVAGGSLRDRLNHLRQLPLEEALAIAADIAAALSFAHERGILHRDIKPENILLSGDRAVVADFGLAQALARAGGDRLTSSGIVVGTPAYISPEQASGERSLGPPTDIYSLACVIYEMIAGVPPFVGPTADSVIAQRFRGPPHSLKQYRPAIPQHVDAAISRGMSIVPADRFQSARDLSAALAISTVTPTQTVRNPRRRSRLLELGAFAALVVAGVPGAIWGFRLLAAGSFTKPPLDTNSYVVLPATGDGGPRFSTVAATRHIDDALRRWQDIRVVNADMVSISPAGVARRYGAGSYLTTSVTASGDSVQVDVAIWTTTVTDAPRAERTVRLPNDSVDAEGPWRRLVAALLVADSTTGDRTLAAEVPRTSSLAAWRAYVHGQAARLRWDLTSADSNFRVAAVADPGFAEAQLWLAQVGAWFRPDQPQTWRDAASRALSLSPSLTGADSSLAAAIAALGANDYPRSCALFRALRDATPNAAVPWLGLGQCLAVDGSVVRDANSPSGWSFRTSWRAAAAAYDSALRRIDGAPTFAYQWLSRILLVDPTWSRTGFGPDSAIFHAYPTLQHDTLAFVPFSATEFAMGSSRIDRSTIAAALSQDAKHIRLAYSDWTQRAPQSADAWESLAFIQEVSADPAPEEGGGLLALRSNATARRLTRDLDQQLRLEQSAVRLLVKTEQFAAANQLADSMLRAIPRANGAQASWLAGIAALAGRVDRTIELLRVKARARPYDVFGTPSAPPATVADASIAYQTLAASGVCGVPLGDALTQLNDAVDRYVAADAREAVRQQVTWRGASLSVPCAGPHAVEGLVATDPVVGLQQVVAAGDLRGFRERLSKLDRARRYLRPGDIPPDRVYQESWLLVATADTAAAARRLDLSLTALTTLNTHLLDDIPRAAALGREMVLRADIAAARHDQRTAQHWASNVLALWAGASPALGNDLERMKKLVAGLPPTRGHDE